MTRDDLQCDGWKSLSDAEKLSVVRKAIASLPSSDHAFGEPRLESFGPAGETQRIAIVEDTRSAAGFAFVPGGRLAPGLGEAEMARFWDLERAWLRVLKNTRPHELPFTALEWSPDAVASGSGSCRRCASTHGRSATTRARCCARSFRSARSKVPRARARDVSARRRRA